jgi:hypothetical protein
MIASLKPGQRVFGVWRLASQRVFAVYTSKNGNTFLNFGAKYPNQTFTGYIPAGSELTGDRWTVTLQGKVIGITGTVELYKGKPEIKVLSMSQIKGADSQPVAQWSSGLRAASRISKRPARAIFNPASTKRVNPPAGSTRLFGYLSLSDLIQVSVQLIPWFLRP